MSQIKYERLFYFAVLAASFPCHSADVKITPNQRIPVAASLYSKQFFDPQTHRFQGYCEPEIGGLLTVQAPLEGSSGVGTMMYSLNAGEDPGLQSQLANLRSEVVVLYTPPEPSYHLEEVPCKQTELHLSLTDLDEQIGVLASSRELCRTALEHENGPVDYGYARLSKYVTDIAEKEAPGPVVKRDPSLCSEAMSVTADYGDTVENIRRVAQQINPKERDLIVVSDDSHGSPTGIYRLPGAARAH